MEGALSRAGSTGSWILRLYVRVASLSEISHLLPIQDSRCFLAVGGF